MKCECVSNAWNPFLWWSSSALPQCPPKITHVWGVDEKQPWADSLTGHCHCRFGASHMGRCTSFSFRITLVVGVSGHVHMHALWGLLAEYSKRGNGHVCIGGEMCLRAAWHAGKLVQAVSQQLAGVSVRENARRCQVFLVMHWNGTEGFLSLRCLCKTWAGQEYMCSEMLNSERSCRLEARLELLLFWPLLESGELVYFIN